MWDGEKESTDILKNSKRGETKISQEVAVKLDCIIHEKSKLRCWWSEQLLINSIVHLHVHKKMVLWRNFAMHRTHMGHCYANKVILSSFFFLITSTMMNDYYIFDGWAGKSITFCSKHITLPVLSAIKSTVFKGPCKFLSKWLNNLMGNVKLVLNRPINHLRKEQNI